jgi:ribosomal protein S27AE
MEKAGMSKKIVCRDCGIEMNHHADKIDYGAALAQGEAVDPQLGGVLQRAHTCPGCGSCVLVGAEET